VVDEASYIHPGKLVLIQLQQITSHASMSCIILTLDKYVPLHMFCYTNK
jgi:hypothetical protein